MYLGRRVIAFKDTRGFLHPTVRHTECALLISEVDGDRCDKCSTYRNTLNRAVARKERSTTEATPHSHTNYRYLSSPEKIVRLREIQHERRISQKRITRLTTKLAELTAEDGVPLDSDMSGDLKEIMEEEDKGVLDRHHEGSFLRLFWDQQKEAMSKHPKGMRWHPLIFRSDFSTYHESCPPHPITQLLALHHILCRWCLYLRHQSSKAYDTLR